MPSYRFTPMHDDARNVSRRHYQPPYDLYETTYGPDDPEELLDPARGKGSYLSAFDAEGRCFPGRFTPSGAIFNGRAIAVYERSGFRRGAVYTHDSKGADHPFLAMATKA